MIWRRAETVPVCKWKDRRDFLTISNKHSVEKVDVKNKRGQVREKPNITRGYNDGMAGIDRSDRILSYCTGFRKSVKWYKNIGFHYADIFVFHAH